MKMIRTTTALLLTALGASPPADAKSLSRATGEAASLTAELGKPVMLAGTKQTAFLKIGLTGARREGARTPVNLALVLDRSSSMSGEKIEKAKEAALMVLERLSPDDIVSVISYDSGVEVLVPATRVSDVEALRRKIIALSPRGSTALFAGLSKGIEESRKFLSAERVNRVILLSDGQANVGPSSPNELGRLGAAAAKEGIAITTIGLGLGYNEDLMARIAQKSDGNHAFAATAEDLTRIFASELQDVLTVVAQEVAIEVRAKDGVRPVRVLNRDAEIFGDRVVMRLNQLYGRQEKFFLLELEVPAGIRGSVKELADVRLSYSDMSDGTVGRQTRIVSARFSESKAEVSQNENRAVMIAAVEAIAAERNRLAVALRDEGKVLQAKDALLKNAGFLQSEGRRLGSKKLDDYGSQTAEDAENLEGEKWNYRRKSMRKRQHTIETQQSY